jgi:ribosomal-protein-alanine N-acetyltransferase
MPGLWVQSLRVQVGPAWRSHQSRRRRGDVCCPPRRCSGPAPRLRSHRVLVHHGRSSRLRAPAPGRWLFVQNRSSRVSGVAPPSRRCSRTGASVAPLALASAAEAPGRQAEIGVELATSRLILREAEPDDALALASYQSDPRYRALYPEVPVAQSEILDAQRIVQLARIWATDLPRLNYQLIITLRPGSTVIGCAGLRRAGYPPGEAEVGIELDPEYWGAGYAREALAALIEFARSQVGARVLWALTAPTNVRVHRLVQGLGFASAPPCAQEARFVLTLAAA